jgi:peptidoglycan-N-acetylglucosamine deacetylase
VAVVLGDGSAPSPDIRHLRATERAGASIVAPPRHRDQPFRVAAQPREVGTPHRVVGDGPFFTVAGGAVRRPQPRSRRGRVALTFDDGPGPQTGAILHQLVKLHAKATFFVVGYGIRARPDMVLQLHRAGMEVGNHSYSHLDMTRLRPAAQLHEVRADESELERVLGYRPLFFRPPGIDWNMETARAVAAEGMVGALLTIDTRDWQRPGTRAIVRRALRVRPGGVIAMHDAGGRNRTETLRAVGTIVRKLRRRGLEPVTLSEVYAG